MKLSVVIPVYEQHGRGIHFLKQSLDVLKDQTFNDFEIVISDNSEDDNIKNFLYLYKELPIRYFKFDRIRNFAGNANNGILKAKGEYIKFLLQDDNLLGINALKDLSGFEGDWLVTGCSNNHHPYYSDGIKQGANTIGSPSVLMIKNENPLLFNEDLNWVVDCEYYIRMFERYGEPTVLNKVNVEIGIGQHQVTNHLSNEIKLNEVLWMHQKYS